MGRASGPGYQPRNCLYTTFSLCTLCLLMLSKSRENSIQAVVVLFYTVRQLVNNASNRTVQWKTVDITK